MIRVEKGQTYTAHRVRSGVSKAGPWELIAVKGLGGDRREITLYVKNNPSHIREGEPFKVTSIESVQVNALKDEEGNWTRDKMSATVYVETALPVDPVGDLGLDLGGDLL